MLGYAFMGKAHTNALKKIPYMTWPPPLVPKLVGIAGRNTEAVQEAADRYNQTSSVTVTLRTKADVARFFDGMELVEPGITPVGVWRPGPMDDIPGRGLSTYTAVGRKP